MNSSYEINVATAPSMHIADLYGILKLRGAVFNVEQRCTDNDVDGRDIEPETLHYWIRQNDSVISCLRVLADPNDAHTKWIGRLCTDAAFRGSGVARLLLTKAISEQSDKTLMLHGQIRLTSWYEGFGFRVVGSPFEEAGIPHIEMLREPGISSV